MQFDPVDTDSGLFSYCLLDCDSLVSDCSFNVFTMVKATSSISINTVNFRKEDIFQGLKKEIIQYHLCCITDKDEELWEKEWGSGGLFCWSVLNHSMGQLILVPKNYP